MKRRIFLASAALLLVCAFCLINNGAKAHAAAMGDPYTTGCANNSSPVNSGTLELNGSTVAWITNYYSSSCNTNWIYMSYDTSAVAGTHIDIHRKGLNPFSSPSSYNHQCYPTTCRGYYTGKISPTWSDMVDGTPVNCIYVSIYGNDLVANSTQSKYGTVDAICA